MIREISTKNMPHEQWLIERKRGIGGSDASTVVGLNPYSSPYELWADKRGLIPPKEENEAMRLGHDLEEYVAKRFCEATGKKVRRKNAIILNTDLPFALANVDRLVVGEDAGLECKTTNALNLSKFKNGDYPATYYVQCQHYMMVTGLPKWYLAVLILGKEFLWFEIERNEEDIAALKDAEEKFWTLVQTNTPPPVDASEACTNTIKAMYQDSVESVVDLSPLKEALDTRTSLDRQIKELTALRDEQDNKIKDYLKENDKGSCEGYKVSWTSSTRSTFDSKRYMADHSTEDFTKYFKVTTQRTFKVTAS